MSTLVLAHGWGRMTAEEWSSKNRIREAARDFGVHLYLPQSQRWNHNWFPSDMSKIVYEVHMAVAKLYPVHRPLVIGGFSDGARPALLAALSLHDQNDADRPDGVIFHSGHWEENDSPDALPDVGLPFEMLCIGGTRDWTSSRAIPRWGRTNPKELAQRYCTCWFEHREKHCWGDVNDYVFDWIEKIRDSEAA